MTQYCGCRTAAHCSAWRRCRRTKPSGGRGNNPFPRPWGPKAVGGVADHVFVVLQASHTFCMMQVCMCQTWPGSCFFTHKVKLKLLIDDILRHCSQEKAAVGLQTTRTSFLGMCGHHVYHFQCYSLDTPAPPLATLVQLCAHGLSHHCGLHSSAQGFVYRLECTHLQM